MSSSIHAFAPYVPLFQTVIWVVVLFLATKLFYPQLTSALEAVAVRVKKGSSLKVGPFELGEDLRLLQPVQEQGDAEPLSVLSAEYDYAGISSEAAPEAGTDSGAAEWNEERKRIYHDNRSLFLSHVIRPSNERGQKYDVFIYLLRHGGVSFDDVDHADFFLGPYWGNKVFTRTVTNGRVGLSTAAYGTFLCTCAVHMKDGTVVSLNRYIDFEMGRVFEAHA